MLVKKNVYFERQYGRKATIPVAVLSKTYVCGCLIAGITGSNPTDGIDVCPLRLLRVM